jgi:hypothetical protein
VRLRTLEDGLIWPVSADICTRFNRPHGRLCVNPCMTGSGLGVTSLLLAANLEMVVEFPSIG